MATLLRQSNDIADLLGGAVLELGREREEDETVYFDNEFGSRKVKVVGNTPAERRERVLNAYNIEICELIYTPNGEDDFCVTDHSGVLRLLEDPLSPPTRTARRNLMTASAFLFLIGATGQMPGKVPGFEVDLKGHPWIIGSLAMATMVYQCASFLLYARADSARRAIAEAELHDHVKVLRENMAKVRIALDTLEASEIAGRLVGTTTGWTMHTRSELSRLEYEWSTARHRRRWDIWLPLPLAAIALLLFTLRWVF